MRSNLVGSVCLAAGLFLAAGSGAAWSQVAGFDSSDYGKIDLPLRESLGSGAEQVLKNDNVFEPIGNLNDSDPLRVAARPIGRLDILEKSGEREDLVTCTASIVSPTLILTNYHCIPGLSGEVEKASLLLNYLEKDSSTTIRLDVDAKPLHADKDLDYALVRLISPLPEGVTPLRLSSERATPGERLVIVHHPLGQVKVMTQYQCAAYKKPSSQADYVAHTCDTLPGSSGGILLNPLTLEAIGLHHTGGLNRSDASSFNLATIIESIVEHEPDSLKVTVADAPPPASPPGGSESAGSAASGQTGNAATDSASINKLIQN